jgi:AcrR family transcriptional regulator
MSSVEGLEGKDARERIVDAAYDLFSHNGIGAVGVDRIVAESGVAKKTLYRNFGSKDELVLEFLRRREMRWTNEWLRADVESRSHDPEERLLAIFDVFDGWFRRDDYEGCSFINVLLEVTDRASSIHEAAVAHLATIRDFLRGLATDAGVRDPDDFARRWHILMKGSIVAAGEGDCDAALRAQAVGRLLLEAERTRA